MGASTATSMVTVGEMGDLILGIPHAIVGTAVQRVLTDARDADRGGPSAPFDADLFRDAVEVEILRIQNGLMMEVLAEAGIPMAKVWVKAVL